MTDLYFPINIPTPYEYLLRDIMDYGDNKADRTGTGTRSIFGTQLRYRLQDGFPLLTTKKVHFKSIAIELLWFLRGDTDISFLKENGVRIWNEWADENDYIGPSYGFQWRNWEGTKYASGERVAVDQLSDVIEQIKSNPDSRRLLVTAWNPAQWDEVGLAPCHVLFQFYVLNGKLSLQVYQRSADMFLGVPFNIASYALLTHMVAHVTGLEVGDLIWTGGDTHIYSNHHEQVEEQLSRDPYPYPTLAIHGTHENIDDFKYEDFAILDYVSHPSIKGTVAV